MSGATKVCGGYEPRLRVEGLGLRAQPDSTVSKNSVYKTRKTPKSRNDGQKTLVETSTVWPHLLRRTWCEILITTPFRFL